ncbi:MAG: hypothetical protein WDZ91_00660 [Paenibacillaceae bacterium]
MKQRLLSGLLASFLLFSLILPAAVNAETTSTKVVDTKPVATNFTVGKVTLTGKSTATIKDAYLLNMNNDKLFTFTVEIFNGGNTDINFVDYWVKVKTKSGSSHSVQLVTADKEKNKISSNSSETFRFHGKVGKTVNYTDIIIEVIKWDFSKANFESVLGNVPIPATYSNVSTAKTVNISGSNIKSEVTNLNINELNETKEATVEVTFENIGTRGVTLPEYKYYLKTSEGLLYPLTSTEATTISVQPKMTNTVEVTTSFPLEIDTKQLYLVIAESEKDVADIPVFILSIPKTFDVDDDVASELSDFKQYSNKRGLYDIKVESIQRLPNGDQDVLAANISVTNKSNKIIPKLDLTGFVTLDGLKLETEKVTAILLDQVLQMGVNAKLNYVLYVKVPYTYEFDTIKLTVQEKVSETSSKTISSFEKHSASFKIPNVTGTLTTSSVGQKTGINIVNVSTFSTQNTNIYYLDVEVENMEKRPTKEANLTGYLVTSDGTYYPVTTKAYDEKVMPNGKILLSMWAQLPKKYLMNGFRLVLGEERGVDANKAIVNAYSLKIPTELAETDTERTSIREIQLYPSTITLKNLNAFIDQRLVIGDYEEIKRRVGFNYEVAQETFYENTVEEKKLVIEVKSGTVITTKTIEVSKDLVNTKNYYEFDLDAALGTNSSYNNSYELTIYEEFMGHKKKIVNVPNISWVGNVVD